MPDLIISQISELVSECFHNLTSNQSNCHWIKEEMRILGTLDHVANIGKKEPRFTRTEIIIDFRRE